MSYKNSANGAEYQPDEIMIVAAARALEKARTVFVGVGLPNIACNLARHTVAPDLELIYESGIYGANPARLPLSIGDPTLVTGALSVIPMADLFGLYLQGGLVEVALVGGAQIDRFGNLNTSVIGSYTHPDIRLPGSGGACEIAINAQRIFIIMHLKKRAFVEKLDFLTSPGHLHGSDTRRKSGMMGAGPELIITDKALFNFENEEREMQLTSLQPGVTLEQVYAEIGWNVKLAGTITEAPAPASHELRLVRALRAGKLPA
ncbi:MAG TPA: CoA-transferase [Ktedonobacteraceae bacterium]|nr:CoA-transferase [Ktedonobacteraceae bacterium]